jgi:excisionase family DNA binding protein
MTAWLTPQQVAESTGRHAVTVYRALESGELHGHQKRHGGRWRISTESVEAWQREQDTRTPCCPAKVVPIRRPA